MVNTVDFAKRLEKLLDYYELSAAAFADKIQVGRSSISHILSGRNKPSLDFIMKILHTYPDVNLYWLMNGKGEFFQEKEDAIPSEKKANGKLGEPKKNEPVPKDEKNEPRAEARSKSGKEIQKVIIFYTDGSFAAFEN